MISNYQKMLLDNYLNTKVKSQKQLKTQIIKFINNNNLDNQATANLINLLKTQYHTVMINPANKFEDNDNPKYQKGYYTGYHEGYDDGWHDNGNNLEYDNNPI